MIGLSNELANESAFSHMKLRYLLFTLVIIIEVLGLLPLVTQVHVAEYDEAIFLDVARAIHTTGTPLRSSGAAPHYYFDHTPLYVYLISPIIGSADDRVAIARWLTAFAALGCVWLVFLCGDQLKSTQAGFVAAVLTAANSFFLLYSYFVTMEALMTFLMLLSFYCLIRSEQRGDSRWCSAAGVALASAVLAKELALGLAAAYLIYSVFVSHWPNRMWRLTMLVGPALAATLAWAFWAWTWSPAEARAAVSRWFASAALSGVDSRMRITIAQWTGQLGGDLLGWVVVALGLASSYFCVKAARKETRITLMPVVYVVVAIVFSYLVRLKELRHLMAVVPMVALMIGVAVNQLFDDLALRWQRLAQFLVGGLIVAAVLDTSPLRLALSRGTTATGIDPLYAFRLFESDRNFGALRAAGLYLAERTQLGEVVTVVHQAPVITFYTDRPSNQLQFQPFDKVMASLARARYLVVDDHVFAQLSEQQIQDFIDYIVRYFDLEVEVTENGRSIPIYRRAGLE